MIDQEKGILYLIPSYLHPESEVSVIPSGNIEIIRKIDFFVVENKRTARRMLRKMGFAGDFDEKKFAELNKHTDPVQIPDMLMPALKGNDIGLLSEAGPPCIADPGSIVVSYAHSKGIKVVPLTGPSSILLALMASGMNGQNFVFHGYLPIDNKARSQKIREIEQLSKQSDQTQVFIETPFRNNQLLEALLRNCNEGTLLCIACDITHPSSEMILTKPIRFWKNHKPDLHKKPVVFLIYSR